MDTLRPDSSGLAVVGLSERATQVYLALIELGPATVFEIARQSGVKRPTVYRKIEELEQKGLISQHIEGRKKYYLAEDPEKLISLIKGEEKILAKLLPYLKTLKGKGYFRPSVRFFEGRGGMKMICEEILKDKQELLSFSSPEDLFQVLEDYFPLFVERRVKLKIPTRVILRDSTKARERKRLGPKELRQVKIIPPTHEFHSMILIFGNKVGMFSFRRGYVAVLIENPEIAAVQRAMFELIWDSLPQ